MSNYEFTGAEKTVGQTVLKQIRATVDMPQFNIKSGDVGGWIESERNLSGDALVSGNAWVSGNARVSGNALVYGNAQVSSPIHVQTVGPIGSEDVTATLFRTKEGHALNVGCWTGTVDTLMAEVERRSACVWDVAGTQRDAWFAQYEALIALYMATMKGWD